LIFSILCSVLQITVYPFVHFSFCHCIVCLSSIYRFWLPLWYPQIFPSDKLHTTTKNLWYKIITHRLVKSNKELYQTQYYTTKARRQVLPPVQVWLETITGRENMLEYYLKPLSQFHYKKTSKISEFGWRSVLFVEKSGVPRENHWLVASHWQTL
jgi:hypothetical protein